MIKNSRQAMQLPSIQLTQALQDYYIDKLNTYPYSTIIGHDATTLNKFLQAVTEFELGHTATWSLLQDFRLRALTPDDLDLVWLRRAAVCLANDRTGLLPWTLDSMSIEQLSILLGLHIDEYGQPITDNYTGFDFVYRDVVRPDSVWANDPSTTNQMALSILDYALQNQDLYDISSPTDIVYALVDYMRHELD